MKQVEENALFFLVCKKAGRNLELFRSHGEVSNRILSTLQHLPLIVCAGGDVLSSALSVAPSVECLPYTQLR